MGDKVMKFGFLFPPLGDPIFVGAEAMEEFYFHSVKLFILSKK